MAFVRRKGKSFYLVHNVREDGRVRQVHLACLGNRPRITDEVAQQVRASHPDLDIDWSAVRRRAAESFASPFSDPEGVRQLARTMRGLILDLKELDLNLLARHGEGPLRDLRQEMGSLSGVLSEKEREWASRPPQPVAMAEEERKSGT